MDAPIRAVTYAVVLGTLFALIPVADADVECRTEVDLIVVRYECSYWSSEPGASCHAGYPSVSRPTSLCGPGTSPLDGLPVDVQVQRLPGDFALA